MVLYFFPLSKNPKTKHNSHKYDLQYFKNDSGPALQSMRKYHLMTVGETGIQKNYMLKMTEKLCTVLWHHQ